ncbi:MAG: flagellar biosynthesis repressor FlbT [Pseudomonadota bacterium]
MTGLVLKLQPNEKFLINGIILQNGDRSARIRIRTKDVSILRSRDAIRPDEADTPVKRIYYVAQVALAGEADEEKAAQQIISGLDQIKPIFGGDAERELARARRGAEDRKFFVVMRALKSLFALETAMLQRATAS